MMRAYIPRGVARFVMVLGVVGPLSISTACDLNPEPFPSSGPPPTFAILYKLISPYGFEVMGSSLLGHRLYDIAYPPYLPAGSVSSFGPTFTGFNQYLVINDGR